MQGENSEAIQEIKRERNEWRKNSSVVRKAKEYDGVNSADRQKSNQSSICAFISL